MHNTEKRVQTPQDLCMSFRIEPYKLFFVTYEDPKGYDWYFDKHYLEPKDNSVIWKFRQTDFTELDPDTGFLKKYRDIDI